MERILCCFIENILENDEVSFFECFFQVLQLFYDIHKEDSNNTSNNIYICLIEKVISKIAILHENEDILNILLEIFQVLFGYNRRAMLFTAENLWDINKMIGNLFLNEHNSVFFHEKICDLLTTLINFHMDGSFFNEFIVLYLKKQGKIDDFLVVFINNYMYFHSNICEIKCWILVNYRIFQFII